MWRELRQISTTEGGNTVHCYLIWDEVTRDAALFDTGWDAAPVFKLIEENQLQLKHLFITHTHADHVAGLQPFANASPKCICTRTPEALRRNTATGATISSCSAACASRTAKPPATRRMA